MALTFGPRYHHLYYNYIFQKITNKIFNEISLTLKVPIKIYKHHELITTTFKSQFRGHDC